MAHGATGTAQPVSRALLPQWAARTAGLAGLASVGALEWQRLIGGYSSARALLWVLAGLLAAGLALAAGRSPAGLRRAAALAGALVLGLLAGYVLSGASLSYLRPRRWDDLVSGLVSGAQALGTVRLPYGSVDPWPAITLQVLGAEPLVLAGLLTFWPRADGERRPRTPLAGPERGFPFLALAVLLVVVASPVVSLGGTRSLALGLVLAALTVAFLWLERLPLRPGIGVAALLGVALAGALPLAAVADRGEPWFDYRAFAEGLGPDDPVHFSWSQTYGPITWPRDGNEVMRVSSDEPLYWKARDLDVFSGLAWTARRDPTPPATQGDESWEADMPEDWRDRPAWTDTISVSIRRMRTTDVLGAGTILSVLDASRPVRPGPASGTWDSAGALRRGDSYRLQVHVPKPDSVALAQASSGERERQPGELDVTVPFRAGRTAPPGVTRGLTLAPPRQAVVHFNGWDALGGNSFAAYPAAARAEYDVDRVMRRSLYARTWALAKRLKRGAKQPYDYIKAVDAYLHGREFTYSERPKQPPPGVAPLDYFLNVSHEGYCQHYAGAMALLLRMGGIPARVATGFSPGGYSARRKAWIVRDTDAHAWVEAWFDRFGWVTFDPTPDATPARSQIAALGPSLPPIAISADRVPPGSNGSGSGTPVPGGIKPGLLRDPERKVGTGGSLAQTATLGGPEGGAGPRAPPVAPLRVLPAPGPRRGAGALALLLTAWLVALRRGPRGGSGMDRAIAELEWALRSVGRPVSTGTTLSQLERRLGSHSPEAGAYLRSLAAGRYAHAAPPPARSGRRALRRALAEGLGFGGRLRALWALPPRVR